MSTSTLPIFPLEHPHILLPASRLTTPIRRELAHAIISLLQVSDTQPIVATFPLLNTADEKNIPVLNEWGTTARVVRLIRPSALNPSQPYLVLLHGSTRVRLARPVEMTPDDNDTLLIHPVQYTQGESVPSKGTVNAFKAAALRLLDRLAQDTGTPARRDAWTRFAAMVDDISEKRAGWLADILVGAISGEYSDRLDFLSAVDVEDRLKRATQLFIKQASISEVSKKIASAVDESLSKQQKEFFLRQQLAAIQRELGELSRSSTRSSSAGTQERQGQSTPSELDDDEQSNADDMAEIKRKIEAMDVGSEERKMAVREWKRLKRIPQASVEHGVIRTYLEWITSLPWLNVSAASEVDNNIIHNRDFLKIAREQLDADHYGLDKIKRRLIEYLAVLKLKQLAADAEIQQVRERAEAVAASNVDKVNDHDIDRSLANTPADKGDADKKSHVVQKVSSGLKPRISRFQKHSVKGPILLFVGPPGTGKTSLGQSIAQALNRPFQRISLGGIRDEAEIRGHRRTYVASGPGAIVQALRKAGRLDPVILLDEIDKVGHGSFHGDPAAALLEVLDPEQNHTFNDHYINVPIDLSKVLFICTSNTLDTISAPLLDRCEVIHLSGYTHDEKLHIARQFLLTKQLNANGLNASQLELTDPALLRIVTGYTHEAGVRSLERAIGAVVRHKAVEWAEQGDSWDNKKGAKVYNHLVDECDLEPILGIPRWDGEERDREERRGIVYGLVVTGQGEGSILPVETIAIPGNGRLKLTGSLGDVIKESGELALSWVKTHAFALRITNLPSQDPLKVPDPIDIHLHLPAGAQKKDGPSAGIAMICAFVSLLTGATVSPKIAMTGEITLRGRVTPVGGIKEKVLGAHRARITKVILPFANKKDVEQDVAREIRTELDFVFVKTVEEALEAAFGTGTLSWRKDNLFIESRL